MIDGVKENKVFAIGVSVGTVLLLSLIFATDIVVGIFMIIGWMLVVLLPLILYFIPTIVAEKTKHKNVLAIGIANLFFGWTFIGWILCLIWAVKK